MIQAWAYGQHPQGAHGCYVVDTATGELALDGEALLQMLDGTAELPAHFAESLAMLGFNPLSGDSLSLEQPSAAPLANQRKVAAARHAKGETMAELAAVYSCSEPTIWRVLQ